MNIWPTSLTNNATLPGKNARQRASLSITEIQVIFREVLVLAWVEAFMARTTFAGCSPQALLGSFVALLRPLEAILGEQAARLSGRCDVVADIFNP